jgi:hypothetical protein
MRRRRIIGRNKVATEYWEAFGDEETGCRIRIAIMVTVTGLQDGWRVGNL